MSHFITFINSKISIVQEHATLSGSLYILLILILASGLFQLVIFPMEIIKLEHMILSFFITIYAIMYLYKNWKKKRTILKPFDFVFYFLLLVFLSFYNAKVFNNQDFNLSFRVTYIWLEYFFVYVLMAKKIKIEDIYVACSIFVIIRLSLFYYTILTGNYIFQTIVGETDMEGARGIMRVRAPGMMITYFWGFWSLGKYLNSRKNLFLIFFIATALQSLLEVSRQHIAAYIILSLWLFLYRLSLLKKVLFTGLLVSFFIYILPQIKIYQALVEITENQRNKTDDFKNDIRVEAATYYIQEFPQSNFTRIMGNGTYHSDSEYGQKVNYAIYNYGYVLSDVGFVGIYIYFGIMGLLFYAYLLYWTIKIPVPSEYSCLKFFIYFLFLTNILSNSFQGSTIILSVTLYILYFGSRQLKRAEKLILVQN